MVNYRQCFFLAVLITFRFKAYYSEARFRYISPGLESSFRLQRSKNEIIKKTAVFLGDKFNFFIDTSDGINEDIGRKEYCGRIIRIVQDYPEKPFLYLKTNHSPFYSSTIADIGAQHNGTVMPCYIWTFRPGYYDHIIPNLKELRLRVIKEKKKFDVGFMGGIDPYRYPKPNYTNPLVAWTDYKDFKIGSPVPTGYYEISSRKVLYDLLRTQTNFFYGNGKPFVEYIKNSVEWKVCFNPPGIGEFTARAFIHSALGQPVFLRKNTYDNPISWKSFWPEVDFGLNNWSVRVEEVVEQYREWGEKSMYYFENHLQPQHIVKYIVEEVEKFEACL